MRTKPQNIGKMLFEEIRRLSDEVAALTRRVDECETRPAEIIDEIHRIWTDDPEAAEQP
jgi:hypothetical protein